MIKHFIFDFDDTLCMTEEAGFYLENSVAFKLGHKPMDRKKHIMTWGRPLPEVISERVPGINVPKFMLEIAIEMKKLTNERKFDLISSETLRTLRYLKNQGYVLSVLTSRVFTEVSHLFSSKYPLSGIISEDRFFYKERTYYHKPDPRVFINMLEYLSAEAREVVYVGDSPTDAVASKLAGMSFVGSLESKLRAKKDFPRGFVDLFINNIADLREIHTRISNNCVSEKDTKVVLDTHGLSSVPHDYFRK